MLIFVIVINSNHIEILHLDNSHSSCGSSIYYLELCFRILFCYIWNGNILKIKATTLVTQHLPLINKAIQCQKRLTDLPLLTFSYLVAKQDWNLHLLTSGQCSSSVCCHSRRDYSIRSLKGFCHQSLTSLG